MVWLPAASDEVVKVAVPLLFNVAVPSWAAPSENVTVPVGVPVPGGTGLTVAVKVTDCPTTDGFADDDTAVVVAILLTVWVSGAELLPTKLPSPLYVAVIVWPPTASDEVVKVAVPLPFTVAVPSWVVPSENVTVPVGVPVPGGVAVTVAVNVIASATVDGFADDDTAVAVAALLTTWVSVLDVLALSSVSPE